MTYDSSESQLFVVHQEEVGKSNLYFHMHKSGLHYYDLCVEHYGFVNTVGEKMKNFTKRQVKGAETARALYKTLSYPSTNDYKWMI